MKRALTIGLIVLLTLSVLVAAAGYWLVNSEQGMRFVLKQTEQLLATKTNQRLETQGLRGSLWQGIEVDLLEWTDGEKKLTVRTLGLRLDWMRLLDGVLVVNTLSARDIELDLPPSPDDQEPFVLPDRISSPVDVQIDALDLAQFKVNGYALNEVSGSAMLRSNELSVPQLSLIAQETDLDGNLTLRLEKPYQTNGSFTSKRNLEDFNLDARLLLTGSLERLELDFKAIAKNHAKNMISQEAEARGVVTPFKPGLIERVTLLAQDFDPSVWIPGAPAASLTVGADLQPNADFTESAGKVVVENSRPASVSDGGLPVSVFKSDFVLRLNNLSPQELDLSIDKLVFADQKRSAGFAEGAIKWRAGVQADNNLPDPDLAAGSLDFSVKTSQVDASVFAELPQRLAIDSDLRGRLSAGQLKLEQLIIRERNARAKGSASLGLKGKMPLDVQLELSGINPAAYVPKSTTWMKGRINGEVYFKGDLKPSGQGQLIDPAGDFRVNLFDSALANAPLTLKAQASGGRHRLRGLLINVDVVGNSVQAQGNYGIASDFVEVDVNLAKLDRLGRLINKDLSGVARLWGKLRVVEGNFSAEGDVDVRQLRLDQAVQIEQVKGQFALGSAPTAPWTGDIQVMQIKAPGAAANTINSMNLTLRGVRNQHELKGDFSSGLQPFSRQRMLKGSFALNGGVASLKTSPVTTGWVGALTALKVEGLWLPARSFALESPAPMEFSPASFEIREFKFRGEDSSLISNSLLRINSSEVRLTGEIPRFSFPRMSPILRKQLTVEPKDLIAKVNWDYLANADKVAGHVDVKHVSGGLQVLEDSQIDVRIQTMLARLDFNREAVSLNLQLQAEEFGSLDASLRVPVMQDSKTKAWSIAGDKTMEGTVAAGFTKLNWLGPLIGAGVRTHGTGQVAMAIGGSANNPDVQGRLFATGLDVFQLDQGVRLEEGNVVIDFTTDKATVDTFEFTVYNRRPPRRYLEQLGPLIQGTGKITAEGQWNLTGRDGELRVSMDKVPLLQRPDRWLKLNSRMTVEQPTTDNGPLKIRGQVDVLGAYFEMPESGPQTLGDDVFIQGRSEIAGPGLPIDLQVMTNLGDRFFVNAEGLRTRLEGGLRLVMLEGVGGSGQRRSGRRLTATGTIRTVDGTYRAYGQDLSIERGVVNFQGPLENPGLNVRAVRKGVAVEAGVEVTGTAQRPKVTLVSEPAVPDSEKLSWMILGRGSGSADRDSTLLLTAAAAIFGNDDESTTRKIAKSLGIDDLNLSTGSLTAADSRAVGSKVAIAPGADASASIIGSDDPLLSQRIVSIGKRLSDKFYLSLNQSVTTAASILKLDYQYSRQLTFIARTGADNAVDVLYQLSFD